MGRGAVIDQLGVRVALALVDGRNRADGYLCAVEVVDESCRDGGVPLDRRFEGHQRVGDGLGHLGRGAVIGQLGVRVALALVDGVVGLLRGVRIAAEAQGPVVVGQGNAQGARGMEVADLVRAGQQVPGHIPQPGGGVDQVSGTTKRSDLRQNPVDGGLQGDL